MNEEIVEVLFNQAFGFQCCSDGFSNFGNQAWYVAGCMHRFASEAMPKSGMQGLALPGEKFHVLAQAITRSGFADAPEDEIRRHCEAVLNDRTRL